MWCEKDTMSPESNVSVDDSRSVELYDNIHREVVEI